MNYDRRTAAVRTLDSVLLAWFKAAIPAFEEALLRAAAFEPHDTRSRSRVQSNLCELDIKTTMPFEPGLREGALVTAEVHVEWALAPSAFDTSVTVSFEDGGKASKDFAFPWTEDPSAQGLKVGKWIESLEPVAPES